MSRSFVSLKVLHERLDELFLLHQESLLGWRPGDEEWAERPLELLDRFERALRAHLRLEEDHLLPIYRRAGRILGGAEKFFVGEHARLLSILADCRATLLELREAGEDWRRATIRLFDQESAFKSLSAHHHQREENILFPTLDKVTDEMEREDVIRLFLGEEMIS